MLFFSAKSSDSYGVDRVRRMNQQAQTEASRRERQAQEKALIARNYVTVAEFEKAIHNYQEVWTP